MFLVNSKGSSRACKGKIKAKDDLCRGQKEQGSLTSYFNQPAARGPARLRASPQAQSWRLSTLDRSPWCRARGVPVVFLFVGVSSVSLGRCCSCCFCSCYGCCCSWCCCSLGSCRCNLSSLGARIHSTTCPDPFGGQGLTQVLSTISGYCANMPHPLRGLRRKFLVTLLTIVQRGLQRPLY